MKFTSKDNLNSFAAKLKNWVRSQNYPTSNSDYTFNNLTAKSLLLNNHPALNSESIRFYNDDYGALSSIYYNGNYYYI